MNIIDISNKCDPSKPYFRVIVEDEKGFDDFMTRIDAQRKHLTTTIFSCNGNFYFTKFKEQSMTEVHFEPISGTYTSTCRKIKFTWEYIFLK